DDKVRRRDVACQQIVEALVDEQLVVVEIQVREDLILVEQIIADRDLAEEICLPQRGLLSMAIEQVEQLSLQRRPGAVGVEISEKRIFDFLEHDRCVEAGAEALRQRGLARADRTFDGEVTEVQATPMITFTIDPS